MKSEYIYIALLFFVAGYSISSLNTISQEKHESLIKKNGASVIKELAYENAKSDVQNHFVQNGFLELAGLIPNTNKWEGDCTLPNNERIYFDIYVEALKEHYPNSSYSKVISKKLKTMSSSNITEQ